MALVDSLDAIPGSSMTRDWYGVHAERPSRIALSIITAGSQGA